MTLVEIEAQTFIKRSSYKNIDDYQSAVDDWQLNLTQLEPGEWHCDNLLLTAGECKYAFTRLNAQKTLLLGQNSGEGFQFHIPLSDSTPPHLLDFKFDKTSILSAPQNQEIQVILPADYFAATLYVSHKLYHEMLQYSIESPVCCPPRHGISSYAPSPDQLLALRQLLFEIAIKTNNKSTIEPSLEDWIINKTEFQVMPLLVQILANGHNQLVQGRPEIFLKAVQLIFQNLDSPPSVNELASLLGTSQRNLQYLFKQHMGMAPKQLIKLARLNRARKDLWYSKYERGKITDIANQLGFWHMGSFSQDFKRLFHKSPSDFLLQKPNRLFNHHEEP